MHETFYSRVIDLYDAVYESFLIFRLIVKFSQYFYTLDSNVLYEKKSIQLLATII